MDIKPHLLRGTGTSVASFGPCVSALAVQNFSSFFVAYCKRPWPRRHTRQPEGSTQHLFSGNSGYELEGPRQLLLAQLASLPSSTHLMAERLSLSDAVGP